MAWSPELVALDIDGTLVDRQGRLLPDAKAAVQRVVEADVPVVLATGRAWLDTRPVFDELELPPGPVVCSNGAVVVQYPPFWLYRARTFDPTRVINSVIEHAPTARIAVEELGVGFRVNRLFPAGELTGRMNVQTLDELAAQPATRVIVRDPDAIAEDFIELADSIGMHGVSYSVGWSAWLDIAPEGINKATALAAVADDLGVPAERVLAIGDGRNDVEMLVWAGRGVAMGDAPREVRAIADAVTSDFAAAGAALELNRWFSFASQSAKLRRTA